MTASPGREVDADLLRGAAPGSALPRADPQDAGRQDLGDLVEALGRGHQVGIKGLGHEQSARRLSLRSMPITYRCARGIVGCHHAMVGRVMGVHGHNDQEGC